jgi:hypothetical protein
LDAGLAAASRVPRNVVSLERGMIELDFVMYRIKSKKGKDRMEGGGLMKWKK